MKLIEIKLAESTINAPKLVTETLLKKNNYFVVFDGQQFYYYAVKIFPDQGGSLRRFEKSPPVLLSGFVIVDQQIYAVSASDLSRRIIRKSNVISLGEVNGTSPSDSTESTATTSIDDFGSTSVQRGVERFVGPDLELEECKAADDAWKEEIRALLSATSAEEGYFEESEWEIADHS